jgi:hypothetical protein
MRKEISFLGKDIVKNPPFHIGHIGLQHLEESKVCWHDMGANDPTHQCAVASDAGLESGGSRVAETSNSGFYELTVLSKKNASRFHHLKFNKWLSVVDIALMHDLPHVKRACALTGRSFGPRNPRGAEFLEYILRNMLESVKKHLMSDDGMRKVKAFNERRAELCTKEVTPH